MDPQIEEIKELVRQNIALTNEVMRQVKGVRNAGRLKSFIWFVFVVASIAFSAYAYYNYVMPQVDRVKHVLESLNLVKGQSASVIQSQDSTKKISPAPSASSTQQ